MMLGKRSRKASMRKTTSMAELSLELRPPSCPMPLEVHSAPSSSQYGENANAGDSIEMGIDQSSQWMMNQGNSADYMGTSHFLMACGLCKRRLGPGRDIYMYRGDTAFCSSECRQQQINRDERKEKCSVASRKKTLAQNSTGSEGSNGEEAMALA